MKKHKTKPKELITRFILDTNEFLSAFDIYEELKDFGIGLATIYRTLFDLEKKGMIIKFIINGKAFYKKITKGNHSYAICLNCGNIVEIDNSLNSKNKIYTDYISKLKNEILTDSGFDFKYVVMNFYGICNECLNSLNNNINKRRKKMKIIITAENNTLDSKGDKRFGRCKYFLVIDPEKEEIIEAIKNPFVQSQHGVGVKAAEFVLNKEVNAVISGSFGPNAYDILKQGDLKLYVLKGETIKEIIYNFNNNKLEEFVSQ